MLSKINWINLIILVGALQGILFTTILLFTRKHVGTGFLIVLLAAFTYTSLETYSWVSGINLDFFVIYNFTFVFTIGPSLYLYIAAILHPDRKFDLKVILKHFAPFMVQFLLKSLLIMYDLMITKLFMVPLIETGSIEYWYSVFSEPLSLLIFLIYVVAAIRLCQNFPKQLSYRDTKYNRQAIKTCTALLGVMAVVAVLWTVTFSAPFFVDIPYNTHFYPVELAVVFFIHWIALAGYRRAGIAYRDKHNVNDTRLDQ